MYNVLNINIPICILAILGMKMLAKVQICHWNWITYTDGKLMYIPPVSPSAPCNGQFSLQNP